MVKVASKEKIIKISKTNNISFWGAGHIAAKTCEYVGINPDFIFDNNPDIEGDNQLGTVVRKFNSQLLSKVGYFIITSSSINEIVKQIQSYGFQSEKILVSPVLENVLKISNFENQNFDILFSSGLQSKSGENIIGGGGLYRVKGKFDNFKLTKIFNSSTHSILKKDDKLICINEKKGITILNSELKFEDSFEVPKGYRPHGLDFCNELNLWVLACAHFDGILILDKDFKVVDEVLFSEQKNYFKNSPQHHCNDLCVVGDKAYISMFSLTGNWKRGIYDGGVMIIDLTKKKSIGNLYSNLLMPHNIVFKEKNFWILDSLRGNVIKGSQDVITSLPAFTRGFDILKNGNLIIGQSKNRNFTLIKNQSNNISLDTSIVIHDPNLSISKSISLPSSVSEIHSIINLDS